MGKRKSPKKRKKKENKNTSSLTLVDKYRASHRDKFIFENIPLRERNGKPLLFGKLNPSLPVRTRDGRPVNLIEIDNMRPSKEQVTFQIEGISDGEIKTYNCSVEGRFNPDGSPHPFDILNISPKTWNKYYKQGKVPVKALE